VPRHNGYARFSACGSYRYELGGDLTPTGGLFLTPGIVRLILWIMLNPSKADADKDDNTVATIGRFSEAWGFGRVLVGNLYAYRATDPRDMKRARKAGIDIVGPENDAALREMVERVRACNGCVMGAWGAHADPDRARAVHEIAGEIYCLKTNQDGSPVHPLYQRMDTVPFVWKGMP
jgi:hypothetical protein